MRFIRIVNKKRVTIKMRRRTNKNACTILISCKEPSEDGKMQVEMSYEGDEVLAAYLLENAHSIIANQSGETKVSSIGN
jgi:hypothetical protein